MNKFSQLKKWRFPAIATLLLTLVLYWALCGHYSYQALEALPAQTALALTAADPDGLDFVGSDSAQVFSKLSLYQVLQQDLARFKKLAKTGNILNLVAGFSLHPSDSLHPVFIFDLADPVLPEQIFEKLPSGHKRFTSSFKGHTVHTILGAGPMPLVFACTRNLVIVSRFSYLVEDALLQLDNRSRWWLRYANPPAAKQQISLRPDVLAERCRPLVEERWMDLPNWLSSSVECLNIYRTGQDWQVEVRLKKRLPGLRPGQWNMQRLAAILPDNTALVTWSVLEAESTLISVLAGSETAADFQRYMQPWVGPEAAYVLGEPFSAGMQDDQFVVFAIRDEALAKQSIKDYGDQTGLLKVYDYQTFEIRQFLSRSLLAPILNNRRMEFANPVCTSINGFMVFAASPSALELLIDKHIVGQTLSNAPDFLYLCKKNIPSGSVWTHLNPGYLPLVFRQMFRREFLEANSADIETMSSCGLYAVDFYQESSTLLRGKLTNQIQKELAAAAGILWKTSLGDEALTQPFFVPDVAAGDGSAILIQDKQLQLYRLNANGTILWRKQLDFPLQSAVMGIDYYKNGTNCFLFNTADAIWILDDEGQALTGFPLRLQSPAINGITLVDFDGDKRYSLFLACQNGNLYGYDQFGRPLPGWNPQPNVGRIKHPLIHFKNGTKDYLAVLSLSGQLSVFNRNGSEHFSPRQFSGSFVVSPPQFDAESESPRIVCANSEGKVYVCNLSGETFALDLATGNKQGKSCFVFENLAGDNRKDYAMLTGPTLNISGYAGKAFKKIASINFANSMDTMFQAGCCSKLGFLDREKRQIFLLDGTGRQFPGFPLAGSTPYVLYPSSRNPERHILVVGNRRDVCAYTIH